MYHYHKIIHIKAVAMLGNFAVLHLNQLKVLCMTYIHVDRCISTHDHMISITALRIIWIAALRMI